MLRKISCVSDNALLQRYPALPGDRQNFMRPGRFCIGLAWLWVFGNHDVRVRSAKAERADRSDARRGFHRPRSQLCWDFERNLVPLDVGVERFEVKMRRYLPGLQG